jgi:hypothetical protein
MSARSGSKPAMRLRSMIERSGPASAVFVGSGNGSTDFRRIAVPPAAQADGSIIAMRRARAEHWGTEQA